MELSVPEEPDPEVPAPVVPVPVVPVLDEPLPEVPVPELPLFVDPLPEPVPELPLFELPEVELLPALDFVRLEFLWRLEFELLVFDVPFLILSSLAFASDGVVVVLLLSPGVADVLSPLLVAPAIATGTLKQKAIATAGIAFKAVANGRLLKLSKVIISYLQS